MDPKLFKKLQNIYEGKRFINIMKNVYDLYLKHGARSNKNVDYFHNYIKTELEKVFKKEYNIVLEYKVKSKNSSGNKKCDIVVLKKNKPYIVFPVKIIKTNYKQNKNNGWENLTGELIHLKWSNPELNIIPINIFMNSTPYLDNSGNIKKFENITINDISNYNILNEKNITYDIINYILVVQHNSVINEKFTKMPNLLYFDYNTEFRCLYEIVKNLL